MAERNAAIHAARRLLLQLLLREVLIDLEPVVDALENGPALGRFAWIFEKSGYFSHRLLATSRPTAMA